MDSDRPIPRRLGLASVSEVVRIIYLAYIQVPNAADKVKFLFEIWKSGQNLKHSTATTCPKKKRSRGRKCALSCLKIFVGVSNVLWKAVRRRRFSYSGTVEQSNITMISNFLQPCAIFMNALLSFIG